MSHSFRCKHNVEELCSQQSATGTPMEHCIARSKVQELIVSAPWLSAGPQL